MQLSLFFLETVRPCHTLSTECDPTTPGTSSTNKEGQMRNMRGELIDGREHQAVYISHSSGMIETEYPPAENSSGDVKIASGKFRSC